MPQVGLETSRAEPGSVGERAEPGSARSNCELEKLARLGSNKAREPARAGSRAGASSTAGGRAPTPGTPASSPPTQSRMAAPFLPPLLVPAAALPVRRRRSSHALPPPLRPRAAAAPLEPPPLPLLQIHRRPGRAEAICQSLRFSSLPGWGLGQWGTSPALVDSGAAQPRRRTRSPEASRTQGRAAPCGWGGSRGGGEGGGRRGPGGGRSAGAWGLGAGARQPAGAWWRRAAGEWKPAGGDA